MKVEEVEEKKKRMHVLYSASVRGSISAPGQTLDELGLSKERNRDVELLELVALSSCQPTTETDERNDK